MSKNDQDLVIEDIETKVNGFILEDEEESNVVKHIDLYDRSLLEDLDLEKSGVKFNPSLTIQNPGENLKIRPLSSGDYDRGYLELLSHLTHVGNISKASYLKRFNSMKRHSGTYYVTVIEDTLKNKVIGAATLVVEQKFIRNCNLRGLLEDVVVSDEYRGRQLGKIIVAVINLLAEKVGCYKLSLNCKDKMVNYYQNLGYTREEGNANYMQIRYPSNL